MRINYDNFRKNVNPRYKVNNYESQLKSSVPKQIEDYNTWIIGYETTEYDTNLFNAIVQINEEIVVCYDKAQEARNKIQGMKKNYGFVKDIQNEGLYEELSSWINQIQDLKRKRRIMIDRIVKISTLSVQEILWVLEQFNFYYKLETISGRSFLMPYDFILIKSGPKKFVSEEEMKAKVMRCNTKPSGSGTCYEKTGSLYKVIDERLTLTNGVDFVTIRIEKDPITKKVRYGISMEDAQLLNKPDIDKNFIYFEESPARVEFNEDIKTIAPIIEVNPWAGVSFYKPGEDGAIFNSESANVIPTPEVLNFIEYYIEAKFEDETRTLPDVFAEWDNRYSQVRK